MTQTPEMAENNETAALQEEKVVPLDASAQRIAQLEEEVAKLKDQWVRAVAETDNVRKRSQRDLEENSKYAITPFAGDMVSVLENLKRASESITPATRAGSDVIKNLGEGVDLTLQELLSTFEKHGIKRIDPMGQKFDHNIHQAVAQVENSEAEAGTVLQVVQAGYMIADRLLRPAMVVVSKAGEGVAKKVDTTA